MTACRSKRTAGVGGVDLLFPPAKRMAQSSAQPWQDAPEDLDLLSGLESLPIWTSQAIETNAPFLLDNLDTAAPAVSCSFPPLSSAEGEALLSLFGEQGQAPQPAQYPSVNLPQTYSVSSSFVRDMPTVDLGTLTAHQQGDPSSYPLNPFLGTRRLNDSQELTQPHSEDMELAFLASMGIANPPAKRGRSSLEVSRSVDSLQTGGHRPQTLPLRSTASWQQEVFSGSAGRAPGGLSRSSQLQVREGQRRFSAPDPHPSQGALFQVPQKQGPALPIRIQPHGLQNPGASQVTRAYGSASPVHFDLGSFPSGVSQDRPAHPRVAYRIRTNALTRRRSNSESRLQERGEEQDKDQSRDVASFHSEGAISNPPGSAASSEQTPRPVDSEDSSGAVQPTSEATALAGATNEPPLMVHPGKLARFLTQLQTIQTKVTRLQQERQTVAEKADMLERGSSMMSQLVDDLEGLQASGASIDQREAKLKAATSDLKQLLAAVTAGAPQLQPAVGNPQQPTIGPSSQPPAGPLSQPVPGTSSQPIVLQPPPQPTGPATIPSATVTSLQGAHPMETSVITAQASQDLPEKDLRQAMDTEDE